MNKRTISILLLILALLVVIPGLVIYSHVFFGFLTFIWIPAIIILITRLQINLREKISIITIIILFYHKNISISTDIIKIIQASYNKKEADNTKIRKITRDMFNKNFTLITDFKKLPVKPSIIICNYCFDRIENLASVLFPVKMSIIMREHVNRIVKIDKLVKWVILTSATGSYEQTKKDIISNISKGRHVFVYVTKHAHANPVFVKGIRSGMFSISKDTGIPITLSAIDYVDIKFGAVTPQNFRITVGDTFVVKNVKDSIYRSMLFYKKTLTDFSEKKYSTKPTMF
jgi:hypothetical protein